MDLNEAVIAFDALSQETRLKVFRMLVEHGPDGAPAGMLSDELGIPHNTLSFHLSHMNNARLVTARRDGRSVIYSANFEFFTDLIRYMVEDCCRLDVATLRKDGKKGSSILDLIHCCQPKTPAKNKESTS